MIHRIENSASLAQAASRLAPGRVVTLSGVWGSAAPLLAAALARVTGRPLLYVCSHLDDADDAAEDMETLAGVATTLFPAWEADVHADHISDEVAAERLRVCSLLAQPAARPAAAPLILLAPVIALLQPVPGREALQQARLVLRTGGAIGLDALLRWLTDAGYEAVEVVEQAGEFTHRGGIIDILPPAAPGGVRVELFGDQIDSIRQFDLDTQRSTEPAASVELPAFAAGRELDPARTTHLLEYLPAESIVCLADAPEVVSLADTYFRRMSDPTGMHRPEKVFAELRRFASVEMYPFSAPAGDAIDVGVQSLQRLTTTPEEALEELNRLSLGADVTVYCGNEAEQHRFGELMASRDRDMPRRVKTQIGFVHHGFAWPAERLVLLGHHELFHRYARRRRLRRVRAGRPIDSFIDLQVGDFVVHVAHGIARFEGLRSLEKEGKRDEFLLLRFADDALLYVPTSQISLVQKYIGATRQRPRLSKLGGAAWKNQKERVAEAVRDMAAEMLRIQAIRDSSVGVAYPGDTAWQGQFEQEFPYTETEDQLGTMVDIKADLGRPRPMDRLLCGDVGFGKTELAIRAAFKVAEAGKQVAVLVPTTVLAAQHARTFGERLADYPFKVEVISRFRSRGEQEQIAKKLVLGGIDVLIGTHRLLSEDIHFADLGLVVIDEEQRFGVAHKERLKAMRATVDVLTMTATPIPRTLHMALLGLRDISNLATPPLDRRAIHTEVTRYDEGLIRQGILRELNRQGQVFFLHNRVQSINRVADRIAQLVPEARVAIGHGQMAAGRLERVMLDFVNQVYDVLVCTTIIESGLDIPTANTMFITNADRFGLAELHQLRGRVGRYKHRAYCYLLLPENRSISPQAAKRLKAVEEFSDLGAGFQIAMRDLEIRGAGNILGSEQSGHIATVGYELYCQLLEEAVRSLKGEQPPPRRDVNIDLGISAFIPRQYIPADRQRMEVYRRIVRCSTSEDLKQLADDLVDAYGKVPEAVQTLLDQAQIRVLAGLFGVESIMLMGKDVIFTIRDWPAARPAFAHAAGSVRRPDERTVYWRPPPNYLEPATLLRVLANQLRRGARQRAMKT